MASEGSYEPAVSGKRVAYVGYADGGDVLRIRDLARGLDLALIGIPADLP
jgi:hypothetical protein